MLGSLPHRQLRNEVAADKVGDRCSLPHRQLRKVGTRPVGTKARFTAAQAAQKFSGSIPASRPTFTAAQAAQKVRDGAPCRRDEFTAAQAAQKK